MNQTTDRATLSDEELEAVMRRVQKLLAIAADGRANQHEAAAAARQAENIMRKYQLENADLLAAKIKKGEDVTHAEVLATAKTNGTRIDKVPTWAQWLAYDLAHLYDLGFRLARVQTRKGLEAAIRFYGYKADVQVACWTLEYLVSTVNRLCVDYRDSDQYKMFGRTAMDSYRKGVALGICAQLKEQLAEKDKAAQVAVQSRALVVVKQAAIEERYGKFEYRETKSQKNDADSFARGLTDGRQVDVNRRAVTNDTKPQPVLK